MAPVAGMLKERGFHVTGSDVNVYPPASTLLTSLGIPWNEGYREENLKPAPDLAVIGNAISRGNPEVERILDDRIPYCSMPQLLEEYFLPGRTSIVVAGTHGKTTTTAMLAWIFQTAGRRPDFLIGGVAPNFGDRSYGLGGGEEFIIEGDEYDTAFFDKGPKFLHYHPVELILTSLEFDHADIYPDLASIALQFRRLVNLVPRRGRILIWGESPDLREVTREGLLPGRNIRPHSGMRLVRRRHSMARRSHGIPRGLSRQRSGAHPHSRCRAPQRSRRARGHRARLWPRSGMRRDRARSRHISKRSPAHGDQGRGGRRSGRRRFRAPSHGHSPHARSRAHPLARPQDLGGGRAALKHHAAKNLSRTIYLTLSRSLTRSCSAP